MGNVRVQLNLEGIKELLNDDGVIADLMERGERIADAADAMMPEGGYKSVQHHKVIEGRTSRGNREVTVMTTSNEAKAMQAKHNTLTRALQAGG